jgi:hypothetical protein
MIDCLGLSWPCTGNCWNNCLNSVTGNSILNTCVTNLTQAACGP